MYSVARDLDRRPESMGEAHRRLRPRQSTDSGAYDWRTGDYSWPEVLFWEMSCRCGSLCRSPRSPFLDSYRFAEYSGLDLNSMRIYKGLSMGTALAAGTSAANASAAGTGVPAANLYFGSSTSGISMNLVSCR